MCATVRRWLVQTVRKGHFCAVLTRSELLQHLAMCLAQLESHSTAMELRLQSRWASSFQRFDVSVPRRCAAPAAQQAHGPENSQGWGPPTSLRFRTRATQNPLRPARHF